MSSFVGDLWKKVSELKLNVSSNRNISAFPYVYDEKLGSIGQIGPFMIFNGQDFDVSNSDRKEESIFRRVSVFVYKHTVNDKMKLELSKRIVKSLKTIRHPRILKYISSKESEGEVILVTEWVEPFKKNYENSNEMEIWAAWSIGEVVEFLKGVGREILVDEESGNLWMTASGEIKVGLFNESDSFTASSFSIGTNINGASKNLDFDKCELVQLSKTFDHLVTLSAGERVSLIKKISNNNTNYSTNCYPRKVLKFLILPELVRTRKFTPLAGTGQETISIDEVQFLFDKGKELILFNEKQDDKKHEHDIENKGNIEFTSSNDFMFLLSDLFAELLSKQSTNPIPLTICLLDQMAGGSNSSLDISELFTEKYAQDKIYPHVSVLLGHPFAGIRESALKALQGLCGRLGAKLIGNDILRQLARLQGDTEGILRFKALEVLAKTVWPKLPETLKSKICGPAVSRALSDSFPPCRCSGLELLRQGINLMDDKEIATKLIPAVGMLLVDDNDMIRGEAFECFEGLILPTLKRGKCKNIKISASVSKNVCTAKLNNTACDSTIGNNSSSSTFIKPSVSTKSIQSPVSSAITNPTHFINNSSDSASKILSSFNGSSSGNKMKLGSIKKII